METIEKNQQFTQEKLLEAKARVVLFAMDFDGTLADGERYTKDDAMNLIEEILQAGKIPAFITARAATAVKTFVPPLEEFYKSNSNSVPTYIAGGNGTVLYRVDSREIKQVYNHGLTLEEIKTIVEKWQGYADRSLPIHELSEKGLATFQKLYQDTWEQLIPTEVLKVGQPFEGRIFTEEAKVTFVFPKDVNQHQKIADEVQKLIGDEYSVAAGDKDFCHITKRLSDDSKLVAVQEILKLENLSINQVATFGDMPHGNDKGLLSFPYSFTNRTPVAELKDLDNPPFILPESNTDPVGSVHRAVRFLLA